MLGITIQGGLIRYVDVLLDPQTSRTYRIQSYGSLAVGNDDLAEAYGNGLSMLLEQTSSCSQDACIALPHAVTQHFSLEEKPRKKRLWLRQRWGISHEFKKGLGLKAQKSSLFFRSCAGHTHLFLIHARQISFLLEVVKNAGLNIQRIEIGAHAWARGIREGCEYPCFSCMLFLGSEGGAFVSLDENDTCKIPATQEFLWSRARDLSEKAEQVWCFFVKWIEEWHLQIEYIFLTGPLAHLQFLEALNVRFQDTVHAVDFTANLFLKRWKLKTPMEDFCVNIGLAIGGLIDAGA